LQETSLQLKNYFAVPSSLPVPHLLMREIINGNKFDRLSQTHLKSWESNNSDFSRTTYCTSF